MKLTNLALLSLCASGILCADVITVVNYSALYSLVDNTPTDGITNSVVNGTLAGEIDDEGFYQNWSFSVEAIAVGMMSFDLPDIPDGMKLKSASLKWAITVYNPNDNLTLGNLLAYHSEDNLTEFGIPGALNKSDLTLAYAGILATPDAPDGFLTSLDVTSFILSDYSRIEGNKMSDFTYEVDGINFNDDGSSALYLMRDIQPDYPIGQLELIFTPIPETNSYALIAGLLALGIAVRTRRSRQ